MTKETGDPPIDEVIPVPVLSLFMPEIERDAFRLLNHVQRGFVTSIRILAHDENIVGDALKRKVADIFPPAVLFSDDLQALPTIYKALRDFLNSRSATLQQYASRRIMMTLDMPV